MPDTGTTADFDYPMDPDSLVFWQGADGWHWDWMGSAAYRAGYRDERGKGHPTFEAAAEAGKRTTRERKELGLPCPPTEELDP